MWRFDLGNENSGKFSIRNITKNFSLSDSKYLKSIDLTEQIERYKMGESALIDKIDRTDSSQFRSIGVPKNSHIYKIDGLSYSYLVFFLTFDHFLDV